MPIIVGGTGFYLRWCIHGKPDTPTSTSQGIKKAKEFVERASLLHKHSKAWRSCQQYCRQCLLLYASIADLELVRVLQVTGEATRLKGDELTDAEAWEACAAAIDCELGDAKSAQR